MVPKVLHYIWLGNSQNELVTKCVDSFTQYMSDYTITKWDESNIDLSWFNEVELSFYNESYSTGKYAFCADLARLHILKRFGGVYVDADVEFIKHLPDEFLEKPILARCAPAGNPCNGIIWACCKNDQVVNDLIGIYSSKIKTSRGNHGIQWIFNTLLIKYFNSSDAYSKSHIIEKYGYNLYPVEYFCPKADPRCSSALNITNNTITIHHFNYSWKR